MAHFLTQKLGKTDFGGVGAGAYNVPSAQSKQTFSFGKDSKVTIGITGGGGGDGFANEGGNASRVKPEAREMAEMGQKGSIGGLLRLEGRNIFVAPKVRRPREDIISGVHAKPSKDQLAENVKRIRRIERKARKAGVGHQPPQSVFADPQPATTDGLWRSQKYDNVKSKLKEELEQRSEDTSRSTHRDFLRARSRCGPAIPSRPGSALAAPRDAGDMSVHGEQLSLNLNNAAAANRRPASARVAGSNAASNRRVSAGGARKNSNAENERPPSRSHSSLDVRLDDYAQKIDYVKLNGMAARRAQVKRPPSATQLESAQRKKQEQLEKYQRGIVPDYLKQRQHQWQHDAEEAERAKPDPDQPPGHRKLEEHERKAMLEKLSETEKELHSQLARLPLRSDTHRVRAARSELETKLAQVEEAKKVFSRRKVFVKATQDAGDPT